MQTDNPTPEAAMVEPFLAQLRRVNTERYHAWVGDGQDAGILFDAAELGGEVGELLNVVKKLVREEAGWRGSRAAPGDFEEECGDVLICLDKLARCRGVDLEAATIAKFNATSEKVDLPHRLAASPPPAQACSETASRAQPVTGGGDDRGQDSAAPVVTQPGGTFAESQREELVLLIERMCPSAPESNFGHPVGTECEALADAILALPFITGGTFADETDAA